MTREEFFDLIEKYNLDGVTAIVAGGKERYHSVYQGLKGIGEADYVFIHDGARPLVDDNIINQNISLCNNDTVVSTVVVPFGNTYFTAFIFVIGFKMFEFPRQFIMISSPPVTSPIFSSGVAKPQSYAVYSLSHSTV